MKKFVVGTAVALASLAFVAIASAAPLPASQHLHLQGTGGAFWNTLGGDAPHDADTRALRMNVGAGKYVFAYSNRSLDIGKDVQAVTNLSFEFKATSYVGAGAPRISVEFQNGDIAYLSALYCNHPMAVMGNAWARADFTRFHNDCSIWVAGQQYLADGARSAWRVYADAHPDQVVEQAYLVGDEAGLYRIDRLSLGAGVMYTSGNKVGKRCTTEASC